VRSTRREKKRFLRRAGKLAFDDDLKGEGFSRASNPFCPSPLQFARSTSFAIIGPKRQLPEAPLTAMIYEAARSTMRILGIAVGVVGVLWLAYFWTAVALYPHVHFAMPSLKLVGNFTMGSAAACAFSGATVSRKWWVGIAASLLTFAVIMARVR
jgi:hypothetical protein